LNALRTYKAEIRGYKERKALNGSCCKKALKGVYEIKRRRNLVKKIDLACAKYLNKLNNDLK